MMMETAEDDNLLYQRAKTQQHGRVPKNYICNKCNIGGHWIKDCPVLPARKSTGIPRSFMVSVDNLAVPGTFLKPFGGYAVHATDYAAYMETNKQLDLPPKIPAPLICSLCNDLMVDSVVVQCCSSSYCDDCIKKSLLAGKCPSCHEKGVVPTPNSFIRNAVNKFTTRTGYSNPRQNVQQEQQQQSTISTVSNPVHDVPVVSTPANTSAISNPMKQPFSNALPLDRGWSESVQQQQLAPPQSTEPEREQLFPTSIPHVNSKTTEKPMDIHDEEPMRSTKDFNYQPPFQQQHDNPEPMLVDEPSTTKKESTPVIFPTPPSSLSSLASAPPSTTTAAPAAAASEVNDCEIITLEGSDINFATMIEDAVRQLGLKVDLMVPKSVAKTTSLISNLRVRGTLFVLVIRPDNVIHNTVTLHILRGRPTPEEHRNMPLIRAYPMIQECYLQILKEKMGPVPNNVKVILSYLLQNRIVTDDQYGVVISSLQTRREKQASVDSRMGCHYAAVNTQDELQQRILKMISLADDDLSIV